VPTAPGGTAPRGGHPRRGRRGFIAGAALVTATIAAGGVAGYVAGRQVTSADEPPATAAPVVHDPNATIDVSGSGQLDVHSVVAKVLPSTVAITSTTIQQQGPFQVEGEGAGTGIILDSEGHILTNAHVVAGATKVTVNVNGESRSAQVVGGDSEQDIAVVKLDDPSGITPATLATEDVAVGDQVVAIGNALALEGSPTVTEGIISAVDRTIQAENGSLRGLIQTDAAISSGNSGGPLVDAYGQVVGINTAVAASGGGVEASNIGFVISIDRALEVARQLIDQG